MNNTFPAFQLLLALSGVLIIGLPLSIWVFMHGNRDHGARLWFIGVAVNAAALILVGILERFSVVSALLFLAAQLPAIESMRWELNYRPSNWRIAALAFVGYAALQLILDTLGLRMTAGYTLNLFLLIGAEIVLVVLALRVSRINNSRGLLMVAVAVSLVLVPNLIRLGQALVEGRGADAFAGSAATNVAIGLITLVSVLHVVGYGGFVMEKLHRRQLQTKLAEARATERQQLAESHARSMEALIQERDEMILLNSRFSTVSNLAIYNSAIVHEIGQPLQALMSILDMMTLSEEPHSAEQSASIQNAISMVQEVSDILAALRLLMAGKQAPLEVLNLDAVLDEILPIIKNQAKREGVTMERHRLAPSDAPVRANRVLLQRVVFNIVSNAFEALANDCGGNKDNSTDKRVKKLELTTQTLHEQGIAYSLLRVRDNGPGLPANLALHPHALLRTTSEHGVGIGLSFTQMIVESWRGEIHIHNLPEDQGGGAVVEIKIPAAVNI